ncbi:MAG: AAA family ATPase, partial [Sandaracinaceae bacterium]|nr:AAA family ATPase [Sandaracinaceae bacterium]
MYLTGIRLRNIGPFEDESLSFTDEEGKPRMTTVILGESGSGKTALLAAIACTRPGLAITPPRVREGVAPSEAFAVARF